MAAKYPVPRGCSVTGCNGRHKGHGLCERHLERLKRTGTTADPVRLTLPQRFWSKVDKRGPNDCWVWTAAKNEHGYGVLHPEGRRTGPTVKAHRLSLTLAGMNVEGRHVLHSCDNPPCVNPAHLSVGDHHANVTDMLSRGRQPSGSRNGASKLTEAQIDDIRSRAAAGELRGALATQYGVSPSTISRIVNRRGWLHVA